MLPPPARGERAIWPLSPTPPAGFTSNQDVSIPKSIVDYIFRYLASKFLSRDEQDVVGVVNRQMSLAEAQPVTGRNQ